MIPACDEASPLLRLIVLGANGQIGTALSACAALRGDVALVPLSHASCDISNLSAIRSVLGEICAKSRCDAIVNAAGWTLVDDAEDNPGGAFEVNWRGSLNLARVAQELNLPLIHLSTDYVFDGYRGTPYSEEDAINPLSYYGLSKAAGEAAIRAVCPAHVILRTSWVFSLHGKSFLQKMIALSVQRDTLSIVADQTGNPTPADEIGFTILGIARALRSRGGECWGTYHYAGTPSTTWFGFASEIMAVLADRGHRTPMLTAVETKDFPTKAMRPPYSALECQKISKVFGLSSPDWRAALLRYINHVP